MKNLGLIIVLILLCGCATQTTKQTMQSQRTKEVTQIDIYNNYQVNISLSQNKNLLQQLENESITESEYDSLLTILGRPGKKYYQIDQLICNTSSDSIYKEIVRAEYFILHDSLIQLVEKHLSDLIKVDSTNASIYVKMGLLKYAQEDLQPGIDYFQKAKSITGLYDNSWLFFILADIYERNNQLLLAIKEYEEVFKENESFLIDKWENLYDLFVSTGDYGKAEDLFKNVEMMSTNTKFRNEYWDKLVDLYWEQDNLIKAESTCLSVRDTSNYTSTTKELVLIAIKNSDFKSAEEHLLDLSLVEIHQFPFQTIYNFVDYYSWNDHYTEIISWLNDNRNLLSENPSANFCYGYLLSGAELNKWDDEERDVSKIREGIAYLKKDISNDNKISFIIAYLLQTINEYEEAINYYENVSDNAVYYPYSQINLYGLTKSENVEKSISYLLNAVESLPSNITLLEKVSLYYYSSMPDYKKAIEWLNKVLLVDPNDHLYSVWLANSYLQLDDTDNAQLIISNTIDRIFTTSDSWMKNWHLGNAYEIKGDINQKLEKWHQAKRDYEKSIAYNPNDMDPRQSLANVYYKLGDSGSAEKTYLTIIDSAISKEKIDYNTYSSVLGNLSLHYMFWEPSSDKQAILFTKAINYFPESDWCYRMLGWAYKEQGNYYKATNKLKKAVELNPDSRYNYSFLAETYELEGTIDKAIENYTFAIRVVEKENLNIDRNLESEVYQGNLKSIGEYRSKIANLYKIKEDFDLAIIEYRRAISVTPDTTGLIYKFDLADAYFDNKDFKKAIENWRLVYAINGDLISLFNIGLSYLKLGDPENLRKSKTTFVEFLDKIEGDPDLGDLKRRAENIISVIDEELDSID